MRQKRSPAATRLLRLARAAILAALAGCASSPGRRRAPPGASPPAGTAATADAETNSDAPGAVMSDAPDPPPKPEPERDDPIPPGPRLYVKPDGSGARDGSSWQDALPGSGAEGALQSAWDRVPPGGVLVVGGGVYEDQALTVREGGTGPGAMRRLAGAGAGVGAGGDAPEGKPVFRGTWRRKDRAKGAAFLRIAGGVRWLGVRDIRIEGYREGVYTPTNEGRNEGLRFVNIDIVGTRDALVLAGGATDGEPESGTHDVIVSGCRLVNYTKRGVRIRGGCRDVFVSGCVADAGGREWAVEAFPIGFQVMGPHGVPEGSAVRDRDVTFVDCVARNNYHDAGAKYWNADGFCAEGGCSGMAYYRCRALDNTDGGWDDKSVRPLLVECVALRNKRNFRFWGAEGATLVRCASAFATKRGGSGGADGLWAKGRVRAERCTFHANPSAVALEGEKARVELDHCIVSSDASVNRDTKLHADGAGIILTDSIVWPDGGDASDPRYVNAPDRDWDGSGRGLESQAFGETHGWRTETGPAPGASREEFLEFLARFK